MQPSSINANEILIIIGTWALVGATLFGILLSNKRTKESNDMLKSDLKARIRPILARTEIGESSLRYEGGFTIAQSDHVIKPEKALIHFANIGELQAVNITKKWDVGIWKDDQYINVKSSSEYKTGTKMADMAPKEKYSVDIEWDPIHYEYALNSSDCYFRLILEYTDVAKKPTKYSYKMEGHFIDGGYLYLDSVNIT